MGRIHPFVALPTHKDMLAVAVGLRAEMSKIGLTPTFRELFLPNNCRPISRHLRRYRADLLLDRLPESDMTK